MRIEGADPGEAARIMGIVASDPWLAPSGIDLSWTSAGEPIQLMVMIDHDSQDFQERVDRLWVLAGRTPPPPLDPAQAIHLDAPDHGGLPPAVAQQLLAHQDRIRAELLNPPADTGTLVHASFPPQQLARALIAVQATAAASSLEAAIKGSPSVGVLDVKVPAEAPAAAVSQFVVALRTEGRLAEAGPASSASRAVVVYAPNQVRAVTDMRGPVPSSPSSNPSRMSSTRSTGWRQAGSRKRRDDVAGFDAERYLRLTGPRRDPAFAAAAAALVAVGAITIADAQALTGDPHPAPSRGQDYGERSAASSRSCPASGY